MRWAALRCSVRTAVLASVACSGCTSPDIVDCGPGGVPTRSRGNQFCVYPADSAPPRCPDFAATRLAVEGGLVCTDADVRAVCEVESSVCEATLGGPCVPACLLSARAGTVGLWCLSEGGGAVSMPAVSTADAPPVRGIDGDGVRWGACGGLEFDGTASNVRIADDMRFDLNGAWTVELVVNATEGELIGPLLERSEPSGCEVDLWALLEFFEDGALQCHVGLTGANDPAATSGPNLVPVSAGPTRIACRRTATGELTVEDAEGDATSSLSPQSNVRTGDGADFRLGAHTRCGSTGYFTGAIRALAIHADD